MMQGLTRRLDGSRQDAERPAPAARAAVTVNVLVNARMRVTARAVYMTIDASVGNTVDCRVCHPIPRLLCAAGLGRRRWLRRARRRSASGKVSDRLRAGPGPDSGSWQARVRFAYASCQRCQGPLNPLSAERRSIFPQTDH
jgi:hypothetical protein